MKARALLGLLGALVALLWSSHGAAQVSVETQIGARKIELGDAVQFQISAQSSDDETPQSPRLPPVPGLSIQGPSVGSRTQVSIMNGRMVRQSGLTATWTVQGTKVGAFRVGPATVEWNGKRFVSESVLLEVVPQGSLPRSPRAGPQPFDPFRMFDPFGSGSPFPGMFGPDDANPLADEPPPVPEEFRVERAPDPIAFIRATVSPKHPVVGEQVTVRFYAYGGRGTFRAALTADASHPDFLDYTGQDDSGASNGVRVPIGDTTFLALKVRELYLFPLRAGRLSVGGLSLSFDGGRYRSNPLTTRTSPALEVDVVEPPLDGRPPGYRIGDVGTLELAAAVDPRRVTAGDTIGVVAKLDGTGSIPTALRVPERRGVEWLDPTHVDQVAAENSVVRGFRAFTYVVKLTEPGHLDLGELSVPYWDPKKRAYATARVKLGEVEVTPNPKPAPSASASSGVGAKLEPGDPLALKPRRTLAPYGEALVPFTDGSRFWYLLFGAPLAVALSGVGLELGGRLKRQRASSRTNPQRLAQEALKAADVAARGSEIAKTAAAVERALFLAIEAGSGIRARALLKSDLEAALKNTGLDAPTVERTVALLDACEAARFTGKAGDLPPRELVVRARALVGELARKRRSS